MVQPLDLLHHLRQLFLKHLVLGREDVRPVSNGDQFTDESILICRHKKPQVVIDEEALLRNIVFVPALIHYLE